MLTLRREIILYLYNTSVVVLRHVLLSSLCIMSSFYLMEWWWIFYALAISLIYGCTNRCESREQITNTWGSCWIWSLNTWPYQQTMNATAVTVSRDCYNKSNKQSKGEGIFLHITPNIHWTVYFPTLVKAFKVTSVGHPGPVWQLLMEISHKRISITLI